MPSQVTDVIGRKRYCGPDGGGIPRAVKLAWTSVVLVWGAVYWHQYGVENFLYFCDLGNLLITLGLWLESRFIISWQAVGLLAFQILYDIDLLAALLSGHHATGGTEYMFDPAIPLLVRALGLYHFVVPILLLWAICRLGYDPRAWKWQIVLMLLVVPINFFWHGEDNINFARGIGHEQHFMPGWLYLTGYLVLVPLVVYWPTHKVLQLLYQPRSGPGHLPQDDPQTQVR
jgi:hypothetical protein